MEAPEKANAERLDPTLSGRKKRKLRAQEHDIVLPLHVAFSPDPECSDSPEMLAEV